ncbi:MAG: hypothetical protein ACE5LU_11875 [Anaerolineae bacterium]
MKHMKNLLVASAAEWGVSLRAAQWIFWIPIAGAAVMVLARLDKDIYRFLLSEDGPIEWTTFACFGVACVAGAGVAIRLFKAGRKWQGALFVGLALVMFFIAGEEIAWGQRVLGLETPESLIAINKQDEITLHNIGETLDVLNFVMMLIGAFGSVAYLLNKRIRVEQYLDQANYLFVPPFFLVPAFFVMFLYKFIRFTVWPKPGFTVTKYGEWAEFCLAAGLSIFTWLNYRRLVTRIEPASTERRRPIGKSRVDE